MGLDMYLDGRKFLRTDWKNPENNPKEDGFEIKERSLRIGYWRKHPDLHGYIVQNFAGGVDECQEIDLSADDLKKIINAVKERQLPHTVGFFFGTSDGSEDEETIQILERAFDWLTTKEPNVSRAIVYQASW